MRRALAPFIISALLCAPALTATAQTPPPPASATPAPSPTIVPLVPPSGPPSPPSLPQPPATPPPATPPAATPPVATPPAGAPASPSPVSGSPAPGPAEAPAPGETPLPTATPTQPPIIVEPPQVAVEPEKTTSARINSALGDVTASVDDPSVATAVVDQQQRVLFVTGVKVGTTNVTLTDARGVTRTVAIRVAYAAGIAADETTLRVTGEPASAPYLRERIADAVAHAATLRPGASVQLTPDQVAVHRDLPTDDRTELDVPVQISGNGYLTVTGTTHVVLINVAMPPIQPARLLVSDYPERLTASGVLFTAHLDRAQAQRFLYYHYDPKTEPARRIVLKARNPSGAPAMVQMIEGSAGPETNEMEVGHLATERFLVREARNEGLVRTIPPNATVDLVDQPLPPETVASGILQLRLVSGNPVDLTLLALDASKADDPNDPPSTTQLLTGGAPHARGVYQVPTFFFERTYDVDGADLEIPIGQLPLPNLRQGEALAGDYGVQQSMTVVIVNMTKGPRNVALYANPRGGRATGTFIIDGTLVQAHALPTFSRYKLWQERINAGTFRRIHIVTMPEGGSNYPLRLVFAPDDGSVPPGAPGSPIY